MGQVKKANKKYTKGKGKVWKKGQCAVSNPECNKYRKAAKQRSYFGNQGTSNLTVEKLEHHNKISMQDEAEEETMSIGKDTALTGFTNCSLPTFSRLLKNWNSNSLLHIKMRAALEAVAEVIKTSGEEESEAKYFSVLNVMLDDVDSDETLTAIIGLLSMVVKKMNKSTLIGLQKTQILEPFTKLLIKHMNSDHCALLRNLLSILYAFLRLRTSWNEKCKELDVILEFTTHHKPKVRRVAHFIVRSLLLNYMEENSAPHPQAANVADFCISKLESKSSDSKEVFYVLNLLQDILSSFPKLNIKKTCETIIKVMTLSNSMVTSGCLKALKGIFSSQSSSLTTELNAKIISAMYPYQPNIKEAISLIDWLQLMESAFLSLYRLDEKLCISHLPNFFNNAVKCWFSEREEVLQAVAITLNNLVQVCIDPTHEVFQGYLFDDPVNNPMHKMFYCVEAALGYQYHRAWKYVILVLTSFFEAMGKHCHTIMLKCLRSLADLHDSHKFPYIGDVEKTLGIAIEQMGPQIVLSAIPLQISLDKPEFPRNWMLSLLKDHTQKTELGFFCRYFIALAEKLKNRAAILEQEGRMNESSLFELLYLRIWSLLPGFCTEPTDLEKVFKEESGAGKGLPRTLADTLKYEPKLRIIVLSAIRLLITKNKENEKHIETMAKFSNNYLPVLFNLYSPDVPDSVEEKVRLATYETIKIYLQITKQEVRENCFNKAVEMLTTLSDNFKQGALLDIARAILPYVNEILIGQLYELSKPLLTHSNQTIQKKAYSVVKEICACESEFCKSFVQSNKDEIRTLLTRPIRNAPAATKALRLSCYQSILSQISIDEMKFIEDIIPEAVISIKETSAKGEKAACSLLVEIGQTYKKLMPGNEKEALKKFIEKLLAGYAGTPRMMSATTIAIGRILYEFRDEIDSAVVHILIENICLLLASPSREIVVSALSFLKILLTTVDTLILAQHVESLVKNVTSISQDNQRHFRFRAKEIFTRLIRKFGHEMISKFVPENYQKQITNIRKLEARKKRKREIKSVGTDFEDDGDANEFDDSDDEMNKGEESLMRKESKLKQVKESYIEEDGEDIVDFMDASAIKKITSRPTKEMPALSSETTREEFPICPLTGKMKITEEPPKLKKKRTEEIPSYQDLIKKKKRKRGADDEENDNKNIELMDEDKPTYEDAVKMKAGKYDGGDDDDTNLSKTEVKKGIHRTLKPTAKKLRPGEEFRAKKAGGDLKKGKLEPYAYLPFNRQALNKRKQVKLKGQYKNIVKAAKRGAKMGLKRKARMSKKNKNV